MTAVVFDVGNVLIDWDARRICRDHFNSDDEISAFLEEIDFHAWNLKQDAGRSWAEGVDCLTERHPRHAALIRRFDTDWQLSVSGAIEGTVAILDRLRGAGVPLYAITNFSAEKWTESTRRFPFLASHFRGVVVSAHERLVKPDPAIFELFLARHGLEAEDCVFIDDSPANVASAASVGFDAIQFDTPAKLAVRLRERSLPV